MKNFRLSALAALLFLAACSGSTGSASLDQKLQNPLYAQRYYEDLVTHMVSLQVHNDPILKNDHAKTVIDQTRIHGVQLAQDAAKKKDDGKRGAWQSDGGEVEGTTLLINDTLYIGPDFLMQPGPSVHLFITNMNDPRQGTFPDTTAIDLGVIQDPYGAQTFTLPKRDATAPELRTLVLYDTQLQKILGFAQLQS